MTDSEIVTMVSAESQEAADIDLRLVGSVTWPTDQNDPRYGGAGTRRWLSSRESETLRAALFPLIAEPEGGLIKAAVDLIDSAISAGTGVGVILP